MDRRHRSRHLLQSVSLDEHSAGRQQPRPLPQPRAGQIAGTRAARDEPGRAPADIRLGAADPRARPALRSALVVAQRRRHAAVGARLRALSRRPIPLAQKSQPHAAGTMKRYFLERMLLLLPTLFGAVTLVFVLIHVVPGDP